MTLHSIDIHGVSAVNVDGHPCRGETVLLCWLYVAPAIS